MQIVFQSPDWKQPKKYGTCSFALFIAVFTPTRTHFLAASFVLVSSCKDQDSLFNSACHWPNWWWCVCPKCTGHTLQGNMGSKHLAFESWLFQVVLRSSFMRQVVCLKNQLFALFRSLIIVFLGFVFAFSVQGYLCPNFSSKNRDFEVTWWFSTEGHFVPVLQCLQTEVPSYRYVEVSSFLIRRRIRTRDLWLWLRQSWKSFRSSCSSEGKQTYPGWRGGRLQ